MSTSNKSIRRVYHWPKILFLIQAHGGRTSLASLAHTVTLGLNKIWDSIEKPKGLRDGSFQEYFDFEFESLPNLELAPEQYNSRVNSLRKRFVEKESTDYLLKDAHPNSISVDGLETYMKTIWVRTLKKLATLYCDAEL